MKISNAWMRDYLAADITNDQAAAYLTDIGLEVEGIEPFEAIRGGLRGIVVGKVLTAEKHPNADKLSLTTVDIGAGQPLNIVCGAPNVAAGQTVAVATVGTEIFLADGTSFIIKEAKIRGEKSQGMICAEDEIGLGQSHDGILVLDENKYQIGMPLADYFDTYEDAVYEIGLTPNRTDAISHFGVARDLHAYLQANGHQAKLNIPASEEPSGAGEFPITVEVKAADQTPRYMAAVLEGVTIKESPTWLQNRLKSIGLSPINNVVDATNYIMHSFGQPMHAFDLDTLQGGGLVVDLAEASETVTTLDKTERHTQGGEIVIRDKTGKILALAGVMGSQESGVSQKTRKILLESAVFEAVSVRKAAKIHGIHSDASFRFERGVDPNFSDVALSQLIALIQETAGGKLVGPVKDHYPKPQQRITLDLRFEKIRSLLGIEIPKENMRKILTLLDFDIKTETEEFFRLAVPTYRVDVTREVDVIEEILRIYGYNKIENPAKISFTPISLNLNNRDALENNWAKMLVGQGFAEVMNNSLTTFENPTEEVRLLNPLSSELAFMRQSLLPGMLQNAAYNINRKAPDLKFFEIGKSYFKRKTYEEWRQMGLLVTGRQEPEQWNTQSHSSNFFHLKGYVRMLLAQAGIVCTEKAFENENFAEALILENKGQKIAVLGKVKDTFAKKYGVEQEVFFAEIELDAVQELRPKENFRLKDLPKFNQNRRDLALLLDNEVNYAEVAAAVQSLQIPELVRMELFDVYQGKNLPDGKKSYAMSFFLLNQEKTMEDAEITAIMNAIVQKLQQKFSAELR